MSSVGYRDLHNLDKGDHYASAADRVVLSCLTSNQYQPTTIILMPTDDHVGGGADQASADGRGGPR